MKAKSWALGHVSCSFTFVDERMAFLISTKSHNVEDAHFKFHVSIRGLLPLLHEAQTERLEVDLMLGLLDDLS